MRGSLLAALACLCAGSVHASGTISCVGDDSLSVEMTIGSLPVLSVVGASIAAGGSVWTTIADADGEPIVVGQAFQDGTRMMIDFTDPNMQRILLQLRLETASQERDFVTAGTLRVIGQGAYALICEGP